MLPNRFPVSLLGRTTSLVIFLHSKPSQLTHLGFESSPLKTHLLVDSLILSWVPLGSLVGGGWDLAGGLAKGLGGWGGHLDGISLKEFAGRDCREMSLGKYRALEGGISQLLCVARQGAKRNRWSWLKLWLVRVWDSGNK